MLIESKTESYSTSLSISDRSYIQEGPQCMSTTDLDRQCIHLPCQLSRLIKMSRLLHEMPNVVISGIHLTVEQCIRQNTVMAELVTRPVSESTAVEKKTACLLASARQYRIGRALNSTFLCLLSLLLSPASILI